MKIKYYIFLIVMLAGFGYSKSTSSLRLSRLCILRTHFLLTLYSIPNKKTITFVIVFMFGWAGKIRILQEYFLASLTAPAHPSDAFSSYFPFHSKQKSSNFRYYFSVWLGWQDSNLRMPESKSGALPLGYSPIY